MAGLLAQLHPRFRRLSTSPGAVPADFIELEEMFRTVSFGFPSDYRELLEEATEIELLLDERRYLRILGPTDAADRTFGYKLWEYFGLAVFFADDGGERMYVFADGLGGPGIYRTWYGDLRRSEAAFVAASVHGLLVCAEGADLLFL